MSSLVKLEIFALLMLCTALLVPLFAAKVQASPTTWYIDTVDAAGQVGGFSSLALDKVGNPHIGYYDWDSGDLKYAKWTGASWFTETVDSAGNVGYFHLSLALDSSDNPHVSYYDWSNGDLKYAKWTGASWFTETVDSAGNVGGYSSIALDNLDNPRISYVDWSNGDLKYAIWTGTSWTIVTVDSAGDVGEYTSLALDSAGNPHISYYDWANDDLKYAKWVGMGWFTGVVDSAGDVGWSSCLALDSAANPHISYYDTSKSQLKYAEWTGTSWAIETVDAAGKVGEYSSSLALDSLGNPHISYYDWTNRDLKYAEWTGTSWAIETVDSAGDVGWFSSLALDSYDNAYISYFAATTADLKYAGPVLSDEHFYTLACSPFDSNSDIFDDAVKVQMDVDTTYSGALNVYVQAALIDPYYNVVAVNMSGWSITGTALEYGYIDLYVPAGSPEGDYTIELNLYDQTNKMEDTRQEIKHLFPPDMHRLTISAVGSGTTNPASGVGMYPNGTEVAVQAFPDAGWRLDHWLLDSITIGGEMNPISVTMGRDRDLTAMFIGAPPTVESCDATGARKDVFGIADNVYLNGSGYLPLTTYNVYIVNDTSWVDGMNIPERVPGTVLSMTLDASGDIKPMPVWFAPLALGKHDVIVDVNNNARYDAAIDALDDNEIQVTAGLIVIPEFHSLVTLSQFMTVALLAALYKRRRMSSQAKTN